MDLSRVRHDDCGDGGTGLIKVGPVFDGDPGDPDWVCTWCGVCGRINSEGPEPERDEIINAFWDGVPFECSWQSLMNLDTAIVWEYEGTQFITQPALAQNVEFITKDEFRARVEQLVVDQVQSWEPPKKVKSTKKARPPAKLRKR